MSGAGTKTLAEDHKLVAAYVSERAGLNMGGMRQLPLMSGISRAMRRAGVNSGEKYRRLLEAQPEEFERLVAALTVGESYFFRDHGQVQLLRHRVLPERVAARGHQGALRLWSAGCASGPEAYTLAMIAEEAGLAGRVGILATDLSRHALDVAEAAVYREWSLRGVSAERQAAYFRPVPEGLRVEERFVAPVTFRQHNLLEASDEGRDIDVVLCRNVLIYLLPDAVAQVARQLAAALAPGGWLLTAAGDPPLDVEELEAVPGAAGSAYRRVAVDAGVMSERHPRPRPAPARRPSPRRRQPASGHQPQAVREQVRRPAPLAAVEPQRQPADQSLERARQALDQADYPAAAGMSRALVEAGEGGSATRAVLVRALASGGDLTAAVAEVATAVAAFPVDAELRLLHALVLMESGQAEQAAEAARAAVYLDGRLALAHLILGQAEASRDNPVAARRSLRNAGSLLQAMPEDAPVPLAGGDTAGRLAAMAAAQERSLRDRVPGGSPARPTGRQR